MQAIILAAGMGKRLKHLTKDNTKCMVKVNGVSLIDRMLSQLDALNLNKIVVVVGYRGADLIDYISALGIKTPIEFIDNPIYDKTNNIYSLSLAQKELLEDDTILLESDLIFEDKVLRVLLDDEYDTLALVDKYESWMDGTVIKIGEDDTITDFVPGKNFVFEDIPSYYKTVNIYKFSKNFSASHYVPFLNAYVKALGENEYYEQVLRVISMLDQPVIKAKRLNGERWYEIDDIQDLDIAESLFDTNPESKIQSINRRYGGYWRYPNLVDFCYLVNPNFPPQRLMNEIKANFETLVTQYPSGCGVNTLLAEKNFGIMSKHILMGNGAAELIKIVTEMTDGKVGVMRPSFDEYPNRFDPSRLVEFYPNTPDYTYTADDLMGYFGDKDISLLVVINPDNPSGSFIMKKDMLRLVEWAKEKGIRLIVDESFIDFSDYDDESILDEGILQEYPNLVLIKSISKSYGVPGFRLGFAASADEELIAAMKKSISIWNINSFGEYFMQIMEKYAKDYKKAIQQFRGIRKRFYDKLSQIEGLRVAPSQANYFMCELTGDVTSNELCIRLLDGYNCLIKDLSGKKGVSGQRVRIAIKDDADNDRIAAAIKEVLG